MARMSKTSWEQLKKERETMARQEREQRREKRQAEKRRLKALSSRTKRGMAVPISGFDERSGKIRIGDRWVDPSPVHGRPLEVRAKNPPGYFGSRKTWKGKGKGKGRRP